MSTNEDNQAYIIHKDYCDTSGKLGYLICKTQSVGAMYYNENVVRDISMWMFDRNLATVYATKAEALFVLQNIEPD